MNLDVTYCVASLMVGIRGLGSSLILQGLSYEKCSFQSQKHPREVRFLPCPPFRIGGLEGHNARTKGEQC